MQIKQICRLAWAATTTTIAANNKFNKNLSYGIKNSTEVKNLQNFLSQKGFYKGVVTGNYLNMTTEAVKAFQKSNNLPATGFFGSMSRTVANNLGADASLSITSHRGGESIELGNTQTITWNSQNYQASDVKVNIIRKIASNPNTYEFVRTVNGKIANKGSATWVPARSDIGNNVFVEVACGESINACHAGITGSALAVVDSSRFANTASAFDAIEASSNK
jgi:peptidoglycan hydrolase-like protein with peptidoglycan-binding domain